MKVPKGYPVGDKMKIAVKIDRALFDKLKARAETKKVAFSIIVEDVLKCGLFDLEESEALEPQP